MPRVLLVFLDGVGIGEEGAHNAFCTATLPTFRSLLGGRVPVREEHGDLAAEAVGTGGACNRATLMLLDATLGVAGTPQSGTGQATLFTGHNAALMHGRHFGPWVPAALRPMLRADSILARAARGGRSVAFANAYPRALIDAALQDPRDTKLPAFMNAGPPVAAAGAGVLTRDVAAIYDGTGVASEFTNEGWRIHLGYSDLPRVTAEQAGGILASIAGTNDLTLFAHYATDSAGHSKSATEAAHALERVDAFLNGVISGLDEDVVLVIASDHGNIEDDRKSHTRNPALGLIYGRDHASLAEGVTSLLHVAPLIARILDVA